MDKKYPALSIVSSLFKTISIIVAVVGIGGSVWLAFQGKQVLGAVSQWSILVAVVGILFTIVMSVLIYALGDLFRCVMDIESNTRKKGRIISQDDIESIAPVKTRRNGSSASHRILKVGTTTAERNPAR